MSHTKTSFYKPQAPVGKMYFAVEDVQDLLRSALGVELK
jgi:hypothetical protein